jgi:HlyD family secretion protein
MDVSIQIGAVENKTFDGTLEFIASKAKLVDGAIQFEVKAAIKPVPGVVIRAGYSANAGIVLERKNQVLALNEKLVQFDAGKLKEGVDASAEIKVPSMAPPSAKN